MSRLRESVIEVMSWGKTWNGADTKIVTGSNCLDMFARSGAMRNAKEAEKELLFSKAFQEDADIAVKLLFYTRDIRSGYGERSTFQQMFRALARIHTDSVSKNLWAVLEFGYAKDLYCLIGTPAETAMWAFCKEQFELDLANMQQGKSVSLLAKWIATPDSAVEKTKKLGLLTAQKLGYSFQTMRAYKKKLRALRRYIDIPEAKMCAGKWNEIEYAKCSSHFLLKHRKAIAVHDSERWNCYLKRVTAGEEKINMAVVNPCDIINILHKDNKCTSDLEVMWNGLPDLCSGNVLVMCDTSGSMWSRYAHRSMKPGIVASALAMYFAQRNKGSLKDIFMTFESTPRYIMLDGATLLDNYRIVQSAPWGGSTNLEAGFTLLLNTAVSGGVKPSEMPMAIIVISDMQINCVHGIQGQRITFYEEMKRRYQAVGYSIPQVVFWNVNATNPTFHAARNDSSVSLVSGYSTNIFRDVMENIGTTPYELMMKVVNSERYQEILA